MATDGPHNLTSRFLPAAVLLACWVAALALAAFRVPVWAGGGGQSERLALHFVAVCQVVSCGLVLPMLRRPAAAGLLAAASAGLVLVPAGHLAGSGWGAVGWCWLVVGVWSAAFAVPVGGWASARQARAMLAAGLVLLGPVLVYVKQDYGTGVESGWWSALPTVGAASTAGGGEAWRCLVAGGFLLIGGIFSSSSTFFSRLRQVVHHRKGVV
ncbi:MAG: hypothetical protein ACFCVE_04670 [Phycisphaerae bacterium]